MSEKVKKKHNWMAGFVIKVQALDEFEKYKAATRSLIFNNLKSRRNPKVLKDR